MAFPDSTTSRPIAGAITQIVAHSISPVKMPVGALAIADAGVE